MKQLFFYSFLMIVSLLFFSCQNDGNTSSSSQTPDHQVHDHSHGHDHQHHHDSSSSTIFDYGKIENQIYSNDFFDFQINVPSSWNQIDRDAMAKATEQGLDLLVDNEQGDEKTVEAARIASAQLLNISQFPIESEVVNNATLMITADNISAFPEIQNGKDYLEHTKETFGAMGMEVQTLNDVSEKIISNVTFHQLEIKINFGDGSISQQYISAVVKDFIFNIVLTYGNEEGKIELEKILNSYKPLSS